MSGATPPEVDYVSLKAGQLIGRYEIVSVLGQGGFGITYRARDVQLGREVAIKEYSALGAGGASGRFHGAAAHDQDGRRFRLGPRSLRHRGAHAREPSSRARDRAGLRFPRSQWHCLYRDGAAERRNARGTHRLRRQAERRGSRSHPVAAARWAGAGPCSRLPASRHQARQHPARRGRQSDIDRFRRVARGHGRAHGGDDGDLHTRLCRGRADDVGQAGTVDRHLRPRRHDLSRHRRQGATQRL